MGRMLRQDTNPKNLGPKSESYELGTRIPESYKLGAGVLFL